MKTKKSSFKVGDSILFVSRIDNGKRFNAQGKIVEIKDVTWKDKAKRRMVLLEIPRGSKYHRLTGKTTTRVQLKSCF